MSKLQILNNKFSETFSCSIEILKAFDDQNSTPPVAIKSSILLSILSIEAAANAFIYSLNLQQDEYKAIDRKPALEKFKFFSQKINADKKCQFNKGCMIVQKIADAFKLRDQYVHPKPTQKNAQYSINHNLVDFTHDYDYMPHLKIKNDIDACSYDDAIEVIRSVVDFINYYVNQVLNLPLLESFSYLLEHSHVQDL